MDVLQGRRFRLGAALVFMTLLSVYVLWHVIWTVFFALTFVYVLYPLREELVDRGVNTRVAAGLLTTGALVGVLGLFAPIMFVLYSRRQAILSFVRNLPLSAEIVVGEFTYVIEATAVVPLVQETLRGWAFDVAAAAPELSAKLFLFVFLIYAILYKPGGVRAVVFRVVDGPVQEELTAYHERVRHTLYGLYFVQAATGALTFLIAFPVFWALGYDASFSLAVIAGVLQFVPVVGPSVVVLALAVIEVAAGDVPQAILVTGAGLFLIGFLPDAVLRPRLAQYSAGIPASVYFTGFLGGVLTLGPVGIIAGPLILSLFIETLDLIGDDARLTVATEATPGDHSPGDQSTGDHSTGDQSTDSAQSDPDRDRDDPGPAVDPEDD